MKENGGDIRGHSRMVAIEQRYFGARNCLLIIQSMRRANWQQSFDNVNQWHTAPVDQLKFYPSWNGENHNTRRSKCRCVRYIKATATNWTFFVFQTPNDINIFQLDFPVFTFVLHFTFNKGRRANKLKKIVSVSMHGIIHWLAGQRKQCSMMRMTPIFMHSVSVFNLMEKFVAIDSAFNDILRSSLLLLL